MEVDTSAAAAAAAAGITDAVLSALASKGKELSKGQFPEHIVRRTQCAEHSCKKKRETEQEKQNKRERYVQKRVERNCRIAVVCVCVPLFSIVAAVSLIYSVVCLLSSSEKHTTIMPNGDTNR